MIADEQREPAATPTAAEAGPEGAGGKAEAKRGGGDKPRRSHGDRAMASLRAAKKGQREVSDPAEKARMLLAEANVLALLDVAEALGGSSAGTEEAKAAESAPSE